MKANSPNKVAIVMGSGKTDYPIMKEAEKVLKELGVKFETLIISAHRTPDRLADYAKNARSRKLKVIIAGAGGAAHLPGMTASMTSLPVLGVPIESKTLLGMDSLLSIVQMPAGVPVGTLSIGKAGAINAALLAASIIAIDNTSVSKALDDWRMKQTESVVESPLENI